MADIALIDSHAHLDYPQLADDLPAVLARAGAAGVSHVITIGVKLSTANALKRSARRARVGRALSELENPKGYQSRIWSTAPCLEELQARLLKALMDKEEEALTIQNRHDGIEAANDGQQVGWYCG